MLYSVALLNVEMLECPLKATGGHGAVNKS